MREMRLAVGFRESRDVESALAMLDHAKHWTLSRRSCIVWVSFHPRVRAMVRRAPGESIAAMIVRCVALARKRGLEAA